MRRRSFLGLATLAGGAAWLPGQASTLRETRMADPALAGLESASGGRLGVALRNGDGRLLAGRRVDERFPMCSTFKSLLVARVLAEVDAGRLSLQQAVPVRAQDTVAYAPVVEPHIGGAITVAALCEAAITLSDNMAANLLLAQVGGPAGVTAWLRGIGDAETRLDRTEPALNTAVPGDPRDTTTPAAMTASLRSVLSGTVLSPASREHLHGWLRDCRTGDARIRAGIPAGWRVGDKTGTGQRNTANDVAVLRTPDGTTAFLAVYLTGADALDDAGRDGTIAAVARIMAGLVAPAR